MRNRDRQSDTWDEENFEAAGAYPNGEGGTADPYYDEDEGPGLILRTDQSLVNVSATVTTHGAPLLSYTNTMNRFYTNRKQRLSLGRYTCEVCGERIRFWAYETPNGNRTHDGCYERMAWMWTNLYAQQQRLAAEGRFE